LALRAHCQTSGWSLTAQDPFNNVVRTCIEAMAATQGQTQSLHTNALDEALGLPTEPSARLALRTQQILAEESGVPSTVDPVAGAYAIEYLTDRVESEAREYLDRVEAMGGATVAVDKGFFQGEIAREAYRVARAREARRELVVGVNAFREGREDFSLFPGRGGRRTAAFQKVSPESEERQVRRVRAWRRDRDSARWGSAMDSLRRATRAGENVMPPLLAALAARATLGEVAGLWRELFGEHTPSRVY
jgi:methylmalonyl-CoA mutase N-terminal domain/subunit